MTMNPFFEDIVIEMSGQGPTGKTGNSIESIVKTSTDVLTDTYTITFTWGNTTTFEVENGNGIVSITKTGTDVLTDTYTVLFSNETTTTFDVVNGRGISSIAKKSTDVLQDVYEITYNDGTTSDYTVTNGRGITSIEKSGSHDNVDIYTISYNDNTVSTFQVVNGIDGTAATIAVGSTTTGLPGTDALVTNSGTSRDAVFNFVIPRGNTGNGIESIALVSTVGLTKTYRVTYTDGDYYDYQVLDGNGIASIALYSTSGLNKTYRVTYTNGDHFDYVVSDGNGISSITLLSTSGLVKTYRIAYTNGTHFDFNVSDGNGIASIEKTGTQGAVDTYTVTFTDPTAEPFEYTVTNGSDTWGAIVGDLSDQSDLQQALDNKAPVITESASGDLVTIADGADLPVESLSVSVTPVQNLHGYDNPWPAGGGKNKLPNTFSSSYSGLTYESISNGKVHVSGTVTAGTWLSTSKTFTLSEMGLNIGDTVVGSASIRILAQFLDSGSAVLASIDSNGVRSISIPSGTESVRVYLYASNQVGNVGDTYNTDIWGQIELGSTVTTWEPNSNICPISGWTQANVWDDPKYGGTIKWNQAVQNGNFSAKQNWSYWQCNYSVTNNEATITNTANQGSIYQDTTSISGHKYLITADLKNVDATKVLLVFQNFSVGETSSTSYQRIARILTLANGGDGRVQITVSGASGNVGYAKNVMRFDLTAMFGAGNEPSTPEEFFALFPHDYYDYDNSYTPTCVSAVNGDSYRHVTIPLGQTVYGATLDVEAGTLTVTHALVDLGTLTWTRLTNYANPFFYADLNGLSTSADKTLVCSQYNFVGVLGVSAFAGKPNGSMTSSSGSYQVYIRDDAYTDGTAFKTAMNGVQLVYTLATPITITGLTPAILRTLIGYNAIWADCGAVSVDYRADTKLFVEKSIAESNATTRKMIADTANGNLAPKSLASGDLIIVGDELRKCTANIGSGSAITDSNSTVANLADVIKALQ